jgi:sulfide:quinone oxidoreductase
VRETFGASVELRLLAPDREFRYRPMRQEELFAPARERALAIGDLVAEAGATWVADRVEVVREDDQCVLTRDGDTIGFDFLLLAPGERSTRPLRQGYLWERGGDPGFLDEIIGELRAGTVESVALFVPRGARWPLPAYELGLILAWTASRTGARVTVVTAEDQPLRALGSAASATITDELDRAGVETITGVELIDAPLPPTATVTVADVIIVPERPADEATALIGKPTDPARVRIGSAAPHKFDRLISLPVMLGPSLAGVASDAAGFVEVDERLRVCGSDRVWAAGGCIATALEHSALSAAQADYAVASMAHAIGVAGATLPAMAPELTGVLLSGTREDWLAANPMGTVEPSTRCLWWPPGRAVGKTLARRIAAWDPTVREQLPTLAHGVPIHAPVALGCDATATVHTHRDVDEAVRRARLHDIEYRQRMAVERHEREAAAELRAMRAELTTLAAHQRKVIASLKQRGYLVDR